MVQAWLKIPFWQRVVAGFVLGALAGYLFGPDAEKWFGWLGDIYVNLIMMIAVPLVLFAVMNAVASLAGKQSIAKLSARTFIWFGITAAIAVLIGLGFGFVMKPGLGVTGLMGDANYKIREVPNFIQVIKDIVPRNPFQAMAGAMRAKNEQGTWILTDRGTMLQVIFWAGLCGFALVKLGDRTKNLRVLIDEATKMMIQVTRYVLEFTPLGTFGLIASLVGAYGFEKLMPLGTYIIALYLACAFHIIVVYSGLLAAHGLNPLKFFKGATPGMQIAFVSSSSLASMPAALRSVTHNLGVDKDYAAFAVPLGSAIKMDGCGAIYPALTSIFVAQYFNVPLDFSHYVIIMLASVLGSFGTAGVPGTATVMVTLVLSAAGLPLEGVGLLFAIDRVLDMMRTMTNVTGQMLVPVIVAKETGLLDQSVYDDPSGNIGLGQMEDEHEAAAV